MSEDEPERLVLEEADVQVEEVGSPSPMPDEAYEGGRFFKSEFDTVERCVMDDLQAPLAPARVQSMGSTAGFHLQHTLSDRPQVDVMTKDEMLFHLNSLEARLTAEIHSHSVSLLDKLEGKIQRILEERDENFAEKLEGLVAAVSGNMVTSFKSSEISGQSGPLPEPGRPQAKTPSGMVTFQQPSDPISGRQSAHGSQRSLRDPGEEGPATAAAPPESTRPPVRAPVARMRHFKMQSIEEVSDALSDRLMEQDSLRAAGLDVESSSSERCGPLPMQRVSTEGVQGSRQHLFRPPAAARNRSSGAMARQVSPAVITPRSKSAGLPTLAATGTKSLLQAFSKTLSLRRDREDKDSPSGPGGAKQQDAIIVPSHDSDEDNLPGSIRPRGEALSQIEEENDSASLPARSTPASEENIHRPFGEAAGANAPVGLASGGPAKSPSIGPAKSSSVIPGKSGSVVALGKSRSVVLGKSSSVLPDRSSSVTAGKSPSYAPGPTGQSSATPFAAVPQGQPAGASSMVGMEKPSRANSLASGNVGKPKALAQSNSGVFGGPVAGHTLSVMYQLPPEQNGVNPTFSRMQSVQGNAFSPRQSRRAEGAGAVKSKVTYVDMEELRRQTEGMILQNEETKKTCSLAVIGEGDAVNEELSFAEVLVALLSRAPLYINGIVPVSNSRAAVVYQSFCLAGAVALPVYYISTLATSPPTEVVWIELIYAGATALGLSSLWWHRIKNLVGDHPKSLDVYADNHGFGTIWHQKSLRHLACILTLWVGEVILQLLVAARPDAFEDFVCEDGDTVNRFVRLIPASICSIIFMVLCYSVAHFSSVLGLMVDNFCTCFGETGDVPNGVQDWNVLQAILRKTALTLDTCIVMLQTSVAAGLLFMGAAVLVGGLGTEACGHRWWMIGLARVMIKFLMVAFCSSIAAAVSQKCARAPPLVNSIIAHAGSEVDTHRSYLVTYMRNSEAGFYIKGVRFTFIEVMKASYLAAVGVFWIVLQLRNKSPL